MDAYILCWRPDRFWLIGPFVDPDTAAEWASDAKNNPSDDPNWHVLSMLDPTDLAAVFKGVVPPDQPLPDDTATWGRASAMIQQTSTSDAYRRGEAERQETQRALDGLTMTDPNFAAPMRRQQFRVVQD